MGVFRNKRGSVTVFLSLIMSGVLLFTVIMVDASKIIGARSMVSGAGNLALSAGLTNYNSVLQDTYGIFAVSKDMKELEKNLEVYFEATLKANGIEDMGLASELVNLVIGGDTSELMDFQSESFKLSGVDGSQLTKTAALKTQILEYSKYRAPVVIGYGFLEKLNILKTLPKQQEALENKVAYEKELSSIEKLCKEIYENATLYLKHLEKTDEMYYKERLSPDGLLEMTFKRSNTNYVWMTKNAIAHIVVEHLECKERWDDNSNNTGGGNLQTSMAQFNAMSGRLASLDSLYYKTIGRGGGTYNAAWISFEPAVQYHAAYLDVLPLFRNVHQQYIEEEEAYRERKEELEDAIDSADEEDDVSGYISDLRQLNDDWKIKDDWYNDEFPIIGNKYSWATVQSEYVIILDEFLYMEAPFLESQMEAQYLWAEELDKYASDTIRGLEELKTKAKSLEQLGGIWDKSISELDTSDVKSNMQLDHDNKAEVVEEEHIEVTIEILKHGKQYAEDVMAELKAVEYVSNPVVNDLNSTTDWALILLPSVQRALGYNDHPEQEPPVRTNSELSDFQVQLHMEPGFYKAIDETRENQVYKVLKEAEAKGETFWDYLSLTPEDVTKKDKVYDFLERSVNAGKVDEDQKKEQEQKQNDMADSVPETEIKDVPAGSVTDVMGSGGSAATDGTVTSVSNTGEAEDTVDNAVDATGSALGNFNLNSLNDILTSGRDKLYLMTYATNMFSCYTTEEGTSTLTNVPYNATNNALFKAEQEYILWGNDDAQTNVNATKGTIFGIRLLLNIIYAYTGDPQLKTETLTMATAIAGWTGFGVPIVQNALLVVAALAETTSDVNRLMDGESVPLYKTVSTWSFRYSTLGMSVEDLVNEAISKGSTKLYEEMNKLTDQMTEEAQKAFTDELEKYTTNVIETTVNTAINSVQAPVMEVILWAASHMEDQKGMMEAEMNQKIEKCFEEMEAQFQLEKSNSDTEGAILADLKLYALGLYNTPANKEALVKMMIEASGIEDAQTQTQELSKTVEDWFNNKKDQYIDFLKEELKNTGVVDTLNSEIANLLSETNTNVQGAVNDKLNEFMNKMGSSSTSIATTDSENIFAEFDSVSASTFSMNYQEYVMVFMAIRFLAAEPQAINCMGNLIQTNATKDDSMYYAGKGFTLDKSYTMLQLESEASIKPTFIKIPDFTADLAGTGVERYPIKYQGVLGY